MAQGRRARSPNSIRSTDYFWRRSFFFVWFVLLFPAVAPAFRHHHPFCMGRSYISPTVPFLLSVSTRRSVPDGVERKRYRVDRAHFLSGVTRIGDIRNKKLLYPSDFFGIASFAAFGWQLAKASIELSTRKNVVDVSDKFYHIKSLKIALIKKLRDLKGNVNFSTVVNIWAFLNWNPFYDDMDIDGRKR